MVYLTRQYRLARLRHFALAQIAEDRRYTDDASVGREHPRRGDDDWNSLARLR